jgi:hypothetical protein
MRSIVKVFMAAIGVMVVVLCWTIGTTSKNQSVALVEPQASQPTPPRVIYPVPVSELEPEPLLPIEERERMSSTDKAYWKASLGRWARIIHDSEGGVHASHESQSSPACMMRFRAELLVIEAQHSDDTASRKTWDGVHDPRAGLNDLVRHCASCSDDYTDWCKQANALLASAKSEFGAAR